VALATADAADVGADELGAVVADAAADVAALVVAEPVAAGAPELLPPHPASATAATALNAASFMALLDMR
jgi:hypothetical protein